MFDAERCFWAYKLDFDLGPWLPPGLHPRLPPISPNLPEFLHTGPAGFSIWNIVICWSLLLLINARIIKRNIEKIYVLIMWKITIYKSRQAQAIKTTRE